MICKQSSFSEYLFSAANTITNIQEPISKIKTKIAEPVKNIYYKVNTTVIGIFVATIIFVIIYCILIEILLSIFSKLSIKPSFAANSPFSLRHTSKY